jgi:hypothetical protein
MVRAPRRHGSPETAAAPTQARADEARTL